MRVVFRIVAPAGIVSEKDGRAADVDVRELLSTFREVVRRGRRLRATDDAETVPCRMSHDSAGH